MSAAVALGVRARAASLDVGELVRIARECVASGTTRRVVLLRLSLLPPELARPHHRRLARAALDPLALADRARLFELENGDTVVIWRGEAPASVAQAKAAIAHLFADTESGLDVNDLLVPLALPQQCDLLFDAIAVSRSRSDAHPPRTQAPLDPAALTRLEDSLARADVARFARRKGIYERRADGRFVLRWEKRFLSVAELTHALSPDHDAKGDPWLFRRLTRSLDRRMLALLAAPDELRDAGPFGLNLNIASILSPEFLRLDAALPAALRGRVVIDMLPADVIADPAAYLFAREFAHARGYRLLLRGLES